MLTCVHFMHFLWFIPPQKKKKNFKGGEKPLKRNSIHNHDVILNLNILFTSEAGFIIASPPGLNGHQLIRSSPAPDRFARLVFVRRREGNRTRQRDSGNKPDGRSTLVKNTSSLSAFENTRKGREEHWSGAIHQTSLSCHGRSGSDTEIQEIANVLISHLKPRGAKSNSPSAGFEFAKRDVGGTNASESGRAATVPAAKHDLPG